MLSLPPPPRNGARSCQKSFTLKHEGFPNTNPKPRVKLHAEPLHFAKVSWEMYEVNKPHLPQFTATWHFDWDSVTFSTAFAPYFFYFYLIFVVFLSFGWRRFECPLLYKAFDVDIIRRRATIIKNITYTPTDQPLLPRQNLEQPLLLALFKSLTHFHNNDSLLEPLLPSSLLAPALYHYEARQGRPNA